MTDLEPLRLRLTEAMSLGGLTQVQVAEKIAITQSTLSRFLRGNPIADDTAEKIASWLDSRKDEPKIPEGTEVQAAIRLYRWMHKVIDDGGTLIVRYPDGREQALLLLM